MSVFRDIEQLINPTIPTSFREDTPPVRCVIWRGGSSFETVEFGNMYPFDTLDNIKRAISTHYKGDFHYLPRFLFIGVPLGEEAEGTSVPTEGTRYLPFDYLWFPPGTTRSSDTIIVANPTVAIISPEERFSTADGSFPPISLVPRGRSTIEDIFLKPRDGRIPTLHVFTLHHLLREYRGIQPIAEAEWNRRLAPYFPNISPEGSFEATEEDRIFGRTIYDYFERREKSLDRLNQFLEEGIPLPELQVTGVRMLRLILQKPPAGFEGCESLFYRIKTTERRPFTRLLPAEGTAVTKVLVKGVLPIPSLEDPEVILQWAKEVSPTAGKDYYYVKYVHRPAIGALPPIYGTIRIFEDGTADLLLQPPKQIRKLEPNLDFRNFRQILTEAMAEMPQVTDIFKLGEASLLFSLKTEIRASKFTKVRLQKRLPLFQTFFQEIDPLPDQNPILSLRYKAVSQYASEDKLFAFLTQFTTQRLLEGEASVSDLIPVLQKEFQLSAQEARSTIDKWFELRGTFSVTVPEENEFMESFNPGIDIHIYAQHPFYIFHTNRIDSYETFQRIYTLLGLMFIDDDEVFRTSERGAQLYEREERSIEEQTLAEDTPTLAPRLSATAQQEPAENEGESIGTANSIPSYLMDLVTEEADEPEPYTAPPTDATIPVPASAPVPVPMPSAPVPVPVPAPSAPGEEGLVNPKSWFLNKLKEIDPRLFNYNPKIKGQDGYSRICAANDDRQPSVLTKAQYDRMREEYDEDENVFFRVYPLEGDSEDEPPPGAEVYYVMRFGSDPANPNYYFCPPLYCLADEIMIRPRDFEAIKDRQGRPKPANTCPFCYGKLITNKNKAIKGHTVIQRKVKKGSDTAHLYIGFAKTTTHPEDLALPCCHVRMKTLRLSDPAFAHFRAITVSRDIGRIVPTIKGDDFEEETEKGTVLEQATEFAYLRERVWREYILGQEKHPLEAGKFAVVPKQFDEYFAQDSNKIIQRTAIRQELRPTAVGFLRIGTNSELVNESLLGVIAPLLYRNSIQEVKERLLEVLVPRIFIGSNFGNLVHEFYSPSDPDPTENTLKSWAASELQIDLTGTNIFAMKRVYKAWHRFRDFIIDPAKTNPTKRIELRHLTPILAEPGLITTRGIQLIILNWNSLDSTKNVYTSCPSYGFSVDRHKKNDFAFLSRDENGIFELFIYTENKLGKGEAGPSHETTLLWDYTSRRVWPDIVTKRVNEYISECGSNYRSLYTPQRGIDPMALLPLSKAIESAEFFPAGLVRDSYNHVVALLFRVRPGKLVPLVALPVVDDGFMAYSLPIYLDWEDYQPAPADEIVQYYRTRLEPLFALYEGYRVKNLVMQRDRRQIIAVQLTNGIYIPAKAPKEETDLPIVEVDEIEWSINKDLSKPCGSDSFLGIKSTYKQLEEMYQHFRLTFANWLSSSGAGSGMRKTIEKVIFSDLPEYEKRKRLYILLFGEIQKWFYPDEEEWELPATFLRKDCKIIDSEDACSGACKWVADSPADQPRCRIHVEAQTTLGTSREVSTVGLFGRRVIDELVRFPNRRKQIMKRDISKLASVIEPIHQGDQYIIPETSPSWLTLLRMEWVKSDPEKPQYYEEMSRMPSTNEKNRTESGLSENIQRIVGENTQYKLWKPSTTSVEKPLLPFVPFMGATLTELDISENSSKLTSVQLVNILKKIKSPVGMIDLSVEPPNIKFVRPAVGVHTSILIFVFLKDGTSGLLTEYEGTPTIRIETLSDNLKRYYEDANRILLKRTAVATTEEGEKPRVLRIVRRAPKEPAEAPKEPVKEPKEPVEVPKEPTESSPSVLSFESVSPNSPIQPEVKMEEQLPIESPTKRSVRRLRVAPAPIPSPATVPTPAPAPIPSPVPVPAPESEPVPESEVSNELNIGDLPNYLKDLI